MTNTMDHNEAATKLKQGRERTRSLTNGNGAWTTISDDWHLDNGDNGGCFVAFSDPSIRSQVLRNTSWDLSKGGGAPGFSQQFERGKWITTYERNTAGPAIEPLIIFQDFSGVVKERILISQEFILLMHLWQDEESGNYFEISDDGSKEPAIKFSDSSIQVRTPLIRRYQAARQLDLLLFTDSVVFAQTGETADAFQTLSENLHIIDGLNQVQLNISDMMGSKRILSRLMTKRILPPPPQEMSGIWPWDRLEESYPEFIIGEDSYGRPIRHTCDPNQLANYFGKNPEAPHYLTPVFFKSEVLQHYYDNPNLYSIKDGYLGCASLWGIRIDNDIPNQVMLFLGDLGRDLPSSERTHWLSYNVVPAGRVMSNTTVKRAFLGLWTEPANPEHTFKQAYSNLRESWRRNWGWDLYRKPSGSDTQIIGRLRIPINDSDGEFETQILNLAKLLVDLLNEKGISARLTSVKDERGISKLERFLTKAHYANTARDIRTLREIQALRSRLAAHTSGMAGKDLLDADRKGLSNADFIAKLMTQAIQMLCGLKKMRPIASDVQPTLDGAQDS